MDSTWEEFYREIPFLWNLLFVLEFLPFLEVCHLPACPLPFWVWEVGLDFCKHGYHFLHFLLDTVSACLQDSASSGVQISLGHRSAHLPARCRSACRSDFLPALE